MKPGLAAIAATLSLLGAAMADEPPVIADFDGTNTLNFPAERSLLLTDVASFEFWVEPEWEGALGYDPVILAGLGAEGPRYAIVMSEDRRGVGLWSGEEWDYVDFDFTDGQLHHVAFVVKGELTEVFLDGAYEETIAQGIEDLPMMTFHIGSLNGLNSPFVGRLGGVRVWDAALYEDDIAAFRRDHIFTKEGMKHPDFFQLVGVSDFHADGTRSFTVMSLQESFAELYENMAAAPDYGALDAVDAELEALVTDSSIVADPDEDDSDEPDLFDDYEIPAPTQNETADEGAGQ